MKPASVIITRFPFVSQLGGEEIHTFMIVEHLKKLGHKVEFLTSCKVLRQYAQANGIKNTRIWMFKPPVSASSFLMFNLLSPALFFWSLIIVLWIRLSRKNPKIYALSFTEKLLFSPWCWLFKIDMIWVEHARIGNWFSKNPWKIWYKLWATGDSVEVVTVSKVMKKDLAMPGVKVIPNAIDAKIFGKMYDASILPDEVLQHLREKKIDIGYVGRLTSDKGMDLLLELKKAMPEVGIITIGSGRYKNLLNQYGIRNFPYMKKEQVACFMQNIDLLVLPATETDPFGLVVLEAIAAKCPTVITDKVGVSDYLVNQKETIVVKPEKFVSEVIKLIKNPAKLKLIAQESDKCLQKFKIEEMLESYAKLF